MNFDRANADAYESPSAGSEYFSSEGLSTVEAELVRDHFDPAKPILDIGCGAGRTTRWLVDHGFDVTGLDLSGLLLQETKERSPEVSCVRASVVRLPFRDESFDQALFSFNGFDYVFPRPLIDAGLREIYRVLAPEGTFVYSGHNIVGRFGRHNQSLRWAAAALVRDHPRFLALQRKGSRIRDWYWRYSEPFGELVAFSAPPWVHHRLQRTARLKTVLTRGEDGRRSGVFVTFTSHHVHYVVKK